MKVVALSGGVGGARFLRGLAQATDPADVTVIGNVGDDVEVLGMHVSPDLDSILYALAGVADAERGWGRADESWVAFEQAELIVICPSNPFISIWPILAVEEIRAAIERRRVRSVAVSPLVGGRAIKGPADRMLERLAGGTAPVRVAGCYRDVIDALVFD